MPNLKRTAKDSVFGCLFTEPEYSLKLYQTLHPEDKTVTEQDVKVITIENVIATRQYNDLGLLIRSTLIVLVEAQSTFTLNVALRLFLYLAESYKEFIAENGLDVYSEKSVSIPRPELFIVYTGERKVPEKIRLSDLLAEEGSGRSESNDVELTARVLADDGTGSIIDQYVQFCKVLDEQRMKYGYTQDAINETIRICREREILVDFLKLREKEVKDIMFTLFNQEEVTARHERAIRAEVREEVRAEGIQILVDAYRTEMGLDDQTIIEKITSKFNLTPERAKSFVR